MSARIAAAPTRRTNTAPRLPTVDEALNPELCPHEFRRGACPTCRRGGAA